MVTLTNVVDQRGLGARRLLAFEHEHLFHIDACACPALEGLDVGAAGPEEPGHVSLLALGVCVTAAVCVAARTPFALWYVSLLLGYVSLLALHLCVAARTPFALWAGGEWLRRRACPLLPLHLWLRRL